MTISISEAVMIQVRSFLNDPEPGSYWTDAELLSYYNMGITRIIAALQESLTKTVVFQLVAGVEQTIPSDGVRVLKVPANVPTLGMKRPEIYEVSAEAMQATGAWYGKPPTPFVRHVIFYPAEDEALRFRVDPPNDGTGQVYLMYAYAPPEATALSNDFGLTEAYRDPMFHYIVAMALGKGNTEDNKADIQIHLSLFNAGIGIKEQADQKTQPIAGSQRTSA